MNFSEAPGATANRPSPAPAQRVFFVDIDGVLLPGRAYYMPHQTEPIQTQFDPCAVGMLNRLCRDLDAKVVIHSNWRNTEYRRERLGTMSLPEHFVQQGLLPEYLHADTLCPTGSRNRWDDILAWLLAHREATDFWILEDTPCPDGWEHRARVVCTDFDEGLTVEHYMRIRKEAGLGTLLLP